MSDDITLKEAAAEITGRELVLPIIQREFVWNPDKISLLFDSILRGYPIGLFLFWKLDDKHRKEYDCYSFHENYTVGEMQTPLNNPLPTKSKYAVLDGQQRLTSICLALKGTYTFAKSKREDPKKHCFYFNLLDNPENAENDIKYEFQFLADEEVLNDETHCWYKVSKVLTDKIWHGSEDAYEVYEQILEQNIEDTAIKELKGQKKEVIRKLTLLYKCICDEEIIKPFVVDKNVSDNEVLDIFVRVNNQGVTLSRTDFIFSKIVSFWQDARQNIEDLQDIDTVKKFKVFDKDLIMRICLAIATKSTVSKLTIDKFKETTVKQIKSKWADISNAIQNTALLLGTLGYDSETINSTNALIPIVYFLYNGGQWKRGTKLTKDVEDIRKYLSIISIKHIFSGHTIGKLNSILKTLNENNAHRPFENVLKMADFSVNKEDIEEAILTPKGKNSFPILSLLYDKKYEECKFDQDHMHPMALFKKKETYKKAGVPLDKMNDWTQKANTLPNLQILRSEVNQSKNDTPLEEWVSETYSTTRQRNSYLKETYLSPDISLEFADFEEFYKKRKQLLVDALKAQLGIRNRKAK